MNNDLISREALKKAITNRLVSVTYNSDYTDGLQEGYLNAINEIDNAPTVEPKQGEWIKNTDTVFKNRFNCSICGKLIFEPKEENNYCSKCGAKMKGGEKE